ncbi:hypothetical protein MUP32_04835 [Candidatus Microgenomates bacterium]|nr:hypothetical protein [Candidatus Microgenomates bacterium]
MIRKRAVIRISLFLLAIFTVRTIISPSCVFAAYTETTYYIHQDHLGSVIAVSDDQGNNVSQTKYSPYGSQQSTINNQLKEHTPAR